MRLYEVTEQPRYMMLGVTLSDSAAPNRTSLRRRVRKRGPNLYRHTLRPGVYGQNKACRAFANFAAVLRHWPRGTFLFIFDDWRVYPRSPEQR